MTQWASKHRKILGLLTKTPQNTAKHEENIRKTPNITPRNVYLRDSSQMLLEQRVPMAHIEPN